MFMSEITHSASRGQRKKENRFRTSLSIALPTNTQSMNTAIRVCSLRLRNLDVSCSHSTDVLYDEPDAH
jgi:hypothetical protein